MSSARDINKINSILRNYNLVVSQHSTFKKSVGSGILTTILSNGVSLSFQLPIDISALDIVLRYNVKDVVIIDTANSYGNQAVVCLNLGNSEQSFYCSKAFIESLFSGGIVNCHNRKVSSDGRVGYNIDKNAKEIWDYYGKNRNNYEVVTPHFSLVKINGTYIAVSLSSPRYEGSYNLVVPPSISYVLWGWFIKTDYQYVDITKPVKDLGAGKFTTNISLGNSKLIRVLNGIEYTFKK